MDNYGLCLLDFLMLIGILFLFFFFLFLTTLLSIFVSFTLSSPITALFIWLSDPSRLSFSLFSLTSSFCVLDYTGNFFLSFWLQFIVVL